MALIPSFMPTPIRDGYAGGWVRSFSRVQMEDNQYQTRRETSREQFAYALSWKLDYTQLAMFEGWLEYDLAKGTGYFDVNFAGKTVTVKPSTGMPEVSPVGSKWLVKLAVEELQSAPVISPRNGVLPSWPIGLPSFESDGYAYAKDSAVTKSDIDFGVADMRVRFRERVTKFTGKILVDLNQRNLFWQFYKDSLINGSAYFLCPFVGSQGETKLRSRFAEKPTEAPNGSWFAISVSLETVKAPILTANQYRTALAD